MKLAWGLKVSQTFCDRVLWIGDDLGLDPSHLMACMAFESGQSFRPDIYNAAGSGAVGLIQFMPQTAASLGTSTAKLAAMTAEDQLNYVWKYFSPWKGKLNNLGDVYMAILWPGGVGRADSYVLFDKYGPKPIQYLQNKGLDTAPHDGKVTRAEASAKIAHLLELGLGEKWAREV
jgi:hypothetical protein